VVAFLLVAVSPAFAQESSGASDPSPITFRGKITHFGAPVVDHAVVVWCSDNLDKFGGSDNTDENGFFEINTTNGDNCSLGNRGFLEVFDENGAVVGFSGHVFIHTQTTVNIKLEGGNPISVPEFGWLGGAASLLATGSVIGLVHRRFAR
jgi:hypothetical protein